MKTIIIGATGLLGLETAKNLLHNHHQVIGLALPPVQKNLKIPNKIELILKNFMKLNNKDILKIMEGCGSLVFAAGIDERIEGKPPIYDKYYKYNIESLERIIILAKESKIRKIVVFGSYFSYLNRVWKDLDLYNKHPYIRSRVEQSKLALSFSDESTIISVLELPYIFGVQKGRKPVWIVLAKKIKQMKFFTVYPKGGSAMITAKQVGELTTRVLERNNTSRNIPVGYYNLTWKAMIKDFHIAMNIHRKIISFPKWINRFWMKSIQRFNNRKGLESGLNYIDLAEIMDRFAFIDNKEIRELFSVKEDDIHTAIIESVKLSMDYLDRNIDLIGMKYE